MKILLTIIYMQHIAQDICFLICRLSDNSEKYTWTYPLIHGSSRYPKLILSVLSKRSHLFLSCLWSKLFVDLSSRFPLSPSVWHVYLVYLAFESAPNKGCCLGFCIPTIPTQIFLTQDFALVSPQPWYQGVNSNLMLVRQKLERGNP